MLYAHLDMDVFLVFLLLLAVGQTRGDTENCLCFENGESYVYQCSNIDGSILPKKNGCNKRISDIAISDSNLENVTKKTFHNLNISDVTKIQLVRCNISDISMNTFSKFRKLLTLDLLDNLLTEKVISRINPSGLRVFRLDGNPLHWIDVHTFHSDVQKTVAELYLNNCGIQYIGDDTLKNLQSLKTLSLSRNNLTNISFLKHCNTPKNQYLTKLNIADNSVENTSLFTSKSKNPCLSKLTSLTIGGNPLQFQTEDIFSLRTLKNLYIQNLQKDTPLPSFDLPSLESLHMDGNYRLKNIRSDLFTNITNLKMVDMAGSNMSLTDLQKLLKPLQYIKSLNLSNASISGGVDRIFRNFTTLESLRLENNKITTISDAFSTLSNLRTLQVNNNTISVVSLQDLPANTNMKFDFSGNPFHCTCATADFRIYCGQNYGKVMSPKWYFCKSPREYAEKSFWTFQPKYSDCHGFNPYIITAIVICVFVVILVVVLSLMSSNKYRIQNFLRVRRLRTGYTQISGSSAVLVT